MQLAAANCVTAARRGNTRHHTQVSVTFSLSGVIKKKSLCITSTFFVPIFLDLFLSLFPLFRLHLPLCSLFPFPSSRPHVFLLRPPFTEAKERKHAIETFARGRVAGRCVSACFQTHNQIHGRLGDSASKLHGRRTQAEGRLVGEPSGRRTFRQALPKDDPSLTHGACLRAEVVSPFNVIGEAAVKL